MTEPIQIPVQVIASRRLEPGELPPGTVSWSRPEGEPEPPRPPFSEVQIGDKRYRIDMTKLWPFDVFQASSPPEDTFWSSFQAVYGYRVREPRG